MPLFSQEKKQQQMILILGAVLVAIFLTLYFGFFRSGGTAPEPIAGGEIGAGGPAVSSGGGDIEDIDFLFLQDPRFLDLKKYGEWPIKPGKTGRSNPFEPFEGYTTEEEEVMEEPVEEPIEETLEEQLEEETLEEVIEEPEEIEEPDEESVERETIEELLRLLNGGGEE